MKDSLALSREQTLALLGQADQVQAAPAPLPVQVQPLPAPQGLNSYGQPYGSVPADHEMPDREQTLSMLGQSDPTMSTGEDMARSGGAGLLRGAASIPTAPVGMQGLAHGLVQSVADFGARHGFGDGKLPDTNSINIPGIGTVPGLSQDLQILAQAGGKMLHINPHAAGLAASVMSPLAAFSGPTTEEAAVAANNGVPLHVPKTAAGRVTERVSEFAPAALAPGSALTRLARVVAPSGGSLAGEKIAPDGYKGVGALLGSLLGGGVEGGREAIVTAPQRRMAEAAASLTPDAVAAAASTMKTAAALPGGGIRVTPYEAAGTPSMLGLQHFLENSPAGKAKVEEYFAARPGQIKSTTQALADAIAPQDASPSASALRNQQAGQGVLDTQRQAINADARPHYEALPGVVTPANPAGPSTAPQYTGGAGHTIPGDQYASLAGNQAYQEALRQLRGDRLLNAGIAHLPDNDLGVVNEVVKQLDRNVAAHEQTANNPSGNNQVAGLYKSARTQADELAASVSPDWRAARDIVRQGHEQVLDPLANGPVGAIARSPPGPGQISAQTNALIPAKPPEGYANDAGQAVDLLPREVTGNLVRHYVMDTLNDVGQDRTNGQPTMNFGGTLAAKLAGHIERASIFDKALTKIDPSGELNQHADDLLGALQATGRRIAPGSGTEFNGQLRQRLQNAPAPVRFMGALVDPLEWGKSIDHAVGGALYKRNVQYLADVLQMSPKDAKAALETATAPGAASPVALSTLLAAPIKTAKKP